MSKWGIKTQIILPNDYTIRLHRFHSWGLHKKRFGGGRLCKDKMPSIYDRERNIILFYRRRGRWNVIFFMTIGRDQKWMREGRKK